MTIETKYNTGDKVWVNKFNRPSDAVVVSIEIYVEYNRNRNYYWVKNEFDLARYKFEEREIFPTKEELIKNLT